MSSCGKIANILLIRDDFSMYSFLGFFHTMRETLFTEKCLCFKVNCIASNFKFPFIFHIKISLIYKKMNMENSFSKKTFCTGCHFEIGATNSNLEMEY